MPSAEVNHFSISSDLSTDNSASAPISLLLAVYLLDSFKSDFCLSLAVLLLQVISSLCSYLHPIPTLAFTCTFDSLLVTTVTNDNLAGLAMS